MNYFCTSTKIARNPKFRKNILQIAKNILSHAACVRQQTSGVRLFPPFAASRKMAEFCVSCGCKVNATGKFCFSMLPQSPRQFIHSKTNYTRRGTCFFFLIGQVIVDRLCSFLALRRADASGSNSLKIRMTLSHEQELVLSLFHILRYPRREEGPSISRSIISRKGCSERT